MREIVVVAAASTLGSVLVGWDSSTIATGMTYIKQEFNLEADPTLEGLIVSMSFLTGTIVTIFSGTVCDWLGRRSMLLIASVMYFLSGLVILSAHNVYLVMVARIVVGVANALAMTLTPLYISEIAPADIRGQLNTFPQFSCSGGMFLAYIMVFLMSFADSPSWRVMLSVVSIPAVVYFLLAMFYLPESPRWLVSKGRVLEARKVLQRIRGTDDVTGELALLAEGMCPGGETTSIEEYIVAPASDLTANQESAKNSIKLYGPTEGVTMVAQPITGQGSLSMVSRSMLSHHGSFTAQNPVLKDPVVTLFGSFHENLPDAGGSRGMLISKGSSVSSFVDHAYHDGDEESNPHGTSDNLRSPLLSRQGTKDRAYASKDGISGMLGTTSNSSMVPGNVGEMASKTNIGGGWQLVYKSSEGAGSGRKDGELQRVYLHADAHASAAASIRSSFISTSGYEIPVEGEAFPAAALVSRSVLGTKDILNKPEVAASKGPDWKGLLEPGVKRALVVGIGLQLLQQAAGINGFLYYAPQILEQAGVGALLSNLGFSSMSASLLVSVVTTFCMLPCISLSMKLMDIAGRRSIMLYTIPILIVSLLVLVLRELFNISSVLNAAITAICVIVYESVFCMGFGVIPNIICAEIFPTSVRGICISVCSLTYWVCTLIVTSAMPLMLSSIGLTGIFGLFVAGNILSWIFVFMKVPETKGMPLEVIIEFFAIGAKPGADPASF
ncbi:hypothetical protein L6164_020279 [Bauhinia variegata]|uniref:Uncharacterized protein n=1 Tax=Bauhinia variegata TaxID=167791 RepID=A0ACB9MUJ6_BAUVA|nr:hypothetical protein L6164_020279 [Bauhinia variegata]